MIVAKLLRNNKFFFGDESDFFFISQKSVKCYLMHCKRHFSVIVLQLSDCDDTINWSKQDHLPWGHNRLIIP